jgi:L-threonine kinase
MASSSADISAACLAAAIAAGGSLTPDEIADIALGIEPTDGIFYPGVVMFDHLNGLTRHAMGCPPTMTIAIFDVGGEVDTLQFNRRSDLAVLNKAKEKLVRQAVELVRRGIAESDCALIGQGATMSALANQDILYKASLPCVVDLALHYGAVGVNTAHSGTVIGILFDAAAAAGLRECITAVQENCAGVTYLNTASLIAGGLSIRGRADR